MPLDHSVYDYWKTLSGQQLSNDGAHNLTRWPNRVDLSHRMYEFFDHYLKGADTPAWMKDGVLAIKKKITLNI